MTNENCWIIFGDAKNGMWWGVLQSQTSGTPASVEFDHNLVLEKENEIIGFYHTHPTFLATPSSRDYLTMGAWVNCFGRSLLCLIEGTDGLRAYWFDDDENEPEECEVYKIEKDGVTFVCGSTQ